jgi:alpha-tubulin suppressor-like RCC1 family protein
VAKGFILLGGECLREPTFLCDGVADVSCSGCLTVVRKTDGSVWCYGYNPYGQCGVDPEQKDAQVGVETVEYLNPMTTLPPCQAVDTGLQHVISLSTTGEVHTWGKGGNGQLGNAEGGYSHIPVKVAISNKCIKVAAGFAHSVAVCEAGDVYVWGKGLSDKKLEEKEQGESETEAINDIYIDCVLNYII